MFLSCGDVLFDVFVDRSSTADTAAGKISLNGNIGGSPLNVASGLSRLGHRSRYLTKISNDLFGQRMREYFKVSDIDYSLCVDTDRNSTLAIVETNDDGSARYVFYTDGTADVSLTEAELPKQLPDDCRVLQFGSYSTAVGTAGPALASLAQRESDKRFICYDPNLRPSIEPDMERWKDTFNSFAATATLIKASDEDIETLYGKNSEDRFVSDCFAKGAALVFITRGPNGSTGFSADGNQTQVSGITVDVVDTVGAGDTYQATLLHWLASEGHISSEGKLTGRVDLEASMTLATRAAAITCTRSGADLPTLAELNGLTA